MKLEKSICVSLLLFVLWQGCTRSDSDKGRVNSPSSEDFFKDDNVNLIPDGLDVSDQKVSKLPEWSYLPELLEIRRNGDAHGLRLSTWSNQSVLGHKFLAIYHQGTSYPPEKLERAMTKLLQHLEIVLQQQFDLFIRPTPEVVALLNSSKDLSDYRLTFKCSIDLGKLPEYLHVSGERSMAYDKELSSSFLRSLLINLDPLDAHLPDSLEIKSDYFEQKRPLFEYLKSIVRQKNPMLVFSKSGFQIFYLDPKLSFNELEQYSVDTFTDVAKNSEKLLSQFIKNSGGSLVQWFSEENPNRKFFWLFLDDTYPQKLPSTNLTTGNGVTSEFHFPYQPLMVRVAMKGIYHDIQRIPEQNPIDQPPMWGCGFRGFAYWHAHSQDYQYFRKDQPWEDWWRFNGLSVADISDHDMIFFKDKESLKASERGGARFKYLYIFPGDQSLRHIRYRPQFETHNNSDFRSRCFQVHMGRTIPPLATRYENETISFDFL